MGPNYWTVRQDKELQWSPSKIIRLMTCFMVSVQWVTLVVVYVPGGLWGAGVDETGQENE